MNYKITLTSIFAALLLGVAGQLLGQDVNLMGFSASESKKQVELESKFDASIQKDNLKTWLRKLSDRPHHVGSPYGAENARFMRDLFKSWGYEVRIDTFYVLFPEPKIRILETLGSSSFKASLDEPILKEDPSSSQKKEQLPTYNCYSADGDVTAELVFVNYGIPEDYEELEKLGIDVKGKIVIAKYGGSWRGIKPKVAAEKGAIGCIIYSDPEDDGYSEGDVYPKGAFKNDKGVQRGSVLDMPLYPGDPLTPAYAATKDAKRLDKNAAPTVMKIPVLPISYSDALPLLKTLEGAVVPDAWKGTLPITYKTGPSKTKVHLKLAFNWEVKPAYNVIATMKGALFPDQWIIRGNHHDAWVNGANDPISGMVAVLEEARSVAEMAKTGWKPKRTIIYCAWDAEEPGLLGSTEWVEYYKPTLLKNAVAYINTDSNGRGFLFAGGSHTLEKWINEIAKTVEDPERKISVSDRLRARLMSSGNQKTAEKADLPISALGSGSDYTPFIQHCGIASINLGFGGESNGGEYHSIYDSYTHYEQFKDVGYHYGLTLVKTAGRMTLRMANAEVLPFEFQNFTATVSQYLDEIMKMTDELRQKTDLHNKMVKEGLYLAASDPQKTFVVPASKEQVPYLNFAPIQNSLQQLTNAALAYKLNLKMNVSLDKESLFQLNQALYMTERYLTREEGLPRRSWFKHQIYAPGFYTGYGVKTLPGVREAIEQRDWKEAQEQILILAEVLDGFTGQVTQINQLLSAGQGSK